MQIDNLMHLVIPMYWVNDTQFVGVANACQTCSGSRVLHYWTLMPAVVYTALY